MNRLTAWGVEGIGEVIPGDQVGDIVVDACRAEPNGPLQNNDVVVVTQDTLKNRRKDLVAFLRASRKGWVENFKDTTAYPPTFKDTWFKGTGRSIENEVFFNGAQKPLMAHPGGVFSMSDDAISACIGALNAVNIKATKAHFDTSLLKEV